MPGIVDLRFVRHRAVAGGLRRLYWDYGHRKERRKKLFAPGLEVFADYVNSQKTRLAAGLAGQPESPGREPLRAAVEWLLRAQAATADEGVSLGYFPLDVEGGWKPSYPETTGYIITTLLRYAEAGNRPGVSAAALAMADWEIGVQMESGAVQGGPVVAPEKQTAAAFNTGMVLDGLCSAYAFKPQDRYLEAARKAARFLAGDLDENGYFRTNGDFVSTGEVKTYTCLCAWAMLRLARLAGEPAIERAALRALEAALRKETANGWFANNCLTLSSAPLTHTIGYVLQGLLESGALSGRDDFIAPVGRALASIRPRVDKRGYLAGRLDRQWRPVAPWACLTGSCQLAIVAYRYATITGNDDYIPMADRLVDFVAATQVRDSTDLGLVGGIAGSFPILGDYMTAGFPNWATKYFIDALMLKQGGR